MSANAVAPLASEPSMRRDRLLAWIALGVGLSLAIARVAAIQGIVSPVEIEGPSMAETLLGRHGVVRCADCRFPWRVDQAALDAGTRLVCPNCGATQPDPTVVETKPGDRVWIDRAAYLLVSPSRGDLVALRDPSDPSRHAVKRVVATPTETWAIAGGDIRIGEQLRRRPLSVARETAVTVHDDRYRPDGDLPDRWRPTQEHNGWTKTDDGYRWSAGGTKLAALRYEQWPCVETTAPRTQPGPIRDVDAFNAALSRPLQVVSDVVVECHATLDAGARLEFVFHTANADFLVELPTGSRRLSAGWLDGRFVAEVDGRSVDGRKVDTFEAPLVPVSLEFQASGIGMVSVDKIRIWRDWHGLDPTGRFSDWSPSNPLGADEYAVLGDNPPASTDARHWPRAIRRGDILGRVLPLAARPSP